MGSHQLSEQRLARGGRSSLGQETILHDGAGKVSDKRSPAGHDNGDLDTIRRPKQSHLLHLVLVEFPNDPRPPESARRAMVCLKELAIQRANCPPETAQRPKKKKKGKRKGEKKNG